MSKLDEWVGGITGGGGIFAIVSSAGKIILAIAALGIAGFFLYYTVYKKKKWNLNIEIKIPRSDGRLVVAEWGKGSYDEKKGLCWIKRKGKRPVAMKPFDPKRYVQGEKILTVLQLSPGHYIPILPDCFLEVVDDKTGEEAIQITKIVADLSESKQWADSFERNSKQAYSIMSMLREYAPYIGLGIILFMNFVGFAILYSKVA